MKVSLFIWGCIIAFSSNSQNSIYIQGKVLPSANQETLFISSEEYLRIIQSDAEGNFNLTIDFDALPYHISVTKLSPRGKITRLSPTFWVATDSVWLKIDLANDMYVLKPRTPFQNLSESIEVLHGKQQLQSIKDSINTYPAIYFLNRNKEKTSLETLTQLMNMLKTESIQWIYSKHIEAYIKAKNEPKISLHKPIVNFSLPNKEGNQIMLIQSNGKRKVVALMSSGCAYSIASISWLAQMHENIPADLEIMSIWDDKTYETWQNAHSEEKALISWTNLWDEYGFAMTYFDRTLTPTFMVLDEHGILLGQFKGYSKKTIKKMNRLLER